MEVISGIPIIGAREFCLYLYDLHATRTAPRTYSKNILQIEERTMSHFLKRSLELRCSTQWRYVPLINSIPTCSNKALYSDSIHEASNKSKAALVFWDVMHDHKLKPIISFSLRFQSLFHEIACFLGLGSRCKRPMIHYCAANFTDIGTRFSSSRREEAGLKASKSLTLHLEDSLKYPKFFRIVCKSWWRITNVSKTSLNGLARLINRLQQENLERCEFGFTQQASA